MVKRMKVKLGLFITAIAGSLMLIVITTSIIINVIVSVSVILEQKNREEAIKDTGNTKLSAKVILLKHRILKQAKAEGIEEYIDVLLAICMQESGGEGTDPFQASESGQNTRYERKPGAIKNVDYSIECGVKEFAYVLNVSNCNGVQDLNNLKIALQSYNFGSGYYYFVKQNYNGVYSAGNAQAFSLKMQNDYGYEVYGDPKYVSNVLRYYYNAYQNGAVGNGEFSAPLPTRHIMTTYEGHSGWDFPADEGTPIIAMNDGEVTLSQTYPDFNWQGSTGNNSYGIFCKISHKDGYTSLYAHMSEKLVKQGDKVKKGQIIGYVGNTGNSYGAHLHLELRENGIKLYPYDYFSWD